MGLWTWRLAVIFSVVGLLHTAEAQSAGEPGVALRIPVEPYRAATPVLVWDLDRPLGRSILPDDTRIIPLHVARTRARSGQFDVPPGYRPAWEDGRLNPYRAIGTVGGRAAMNDVWTATVPRRLEPSIGKTVRRAAPSVAYPPSPDRNPVGRTPAAAARGVHAAGWGR